MTTRKPDYRLALPRFICGHDRTAHRECQTCKRERDKRRMRRLRANAARRPYWREYDAARGRTSTAPVTVKPYTPKRPTWIAAITPVQLAEARALFNRECGVPDSTDTAQQRMALGGES